MWTLELTKTIINIPKLDSELRDLNAKYVGISVKGDSLKIQFISPLTQEEVDEVSGHINSFVEVCIVEQLKEYVEKDIKPFIDNLLYQMQAENISMGITQAGKTADVLGFFCQKVLLPGKVREVSIKQTLDTNSLTVTYELLLYFIANPSQYSDLSPFITTDRLTDWKNKVAEKLGI
jgi:hypothetical protein